MPASDSRSSAVALIRRLELAPPAALATHLAAARHHPRQRAVVEARPLGVGRVHPRRVRAPARLATSWEPAV